ncbi:3'-5' exonuclease [Tunturiibacter empetritectus]|uniref:DNA 3'-5' helicase II n=1 Tax=Tunturiibacter lichenicola TaxID=2051959 RepID=A0A852VEM2_9BACT|nr:nuclease-related domain-containing DEAD/DEAH box helicase [Edaphobacter lichenicola]NYF91308.1 hypothetical protein [Edaphobacter lichenicola]
MAEMIPESIAAMKEATSGEKRVFKVLRDALLPDEEFIVWFEPKAVKKRPDFLVWSQDLGLLVIEVKDWGLKQIVDLNPERWTIRWDNVLKTQDSPVEQARKCFIKFKELIQKSPELRHKDGPNQGNIRFPIGYCAAFTQITRKQAGDSGIIRALGPVFCLFSDDLTDTFDSKESRRKLVSKLKKTFVITFPFDPLTADELKTLRYLIFPEVRINNVRSDNACVLRDPDQSAMIRALDLEQERTAKSILEGHRVLKGVAGSGKTLVLSCRAKYLKKLQPNWRILIVCYNISLRQYIQQLLTISEPESEHIGIEVFHYHGLVKELTGASLQRRDSETQEQWDERTGVILREAIASGSIAKYDAILIDEGQDFAVEWLQSLTELLEEKSDSLLFCLDPAQNIFGRKVSFKSVGIKVQGKRPVSLNRSYRNTAEILSLARNFSKVQDIPTDPDTESAIESLLFPVDVNRHGQPPQIICGMASVDQIQYILKEISEYIDGGLCSWCDVDVLYVSPNFAKSFSSAFEKRFGNEKLYWVSESRQSKMGLNLSSPSLKLSTIESAKGMEFRLVFLLGIEMLPRPDRDEASERKLAYVGLTRAQDLLYILGNTQSGFLNELIEISEMLSTTVQM